MNNGYHEGLACEHVFLVGPPCADVATMITPGGHAFCTKHFEDWLRGIRDPEATRAMSRRIA